MALAEAQWGCPLPVIDLLALRPACPDSLEATIKVGAGAFVASLSPVSLYLCLCSRGTRPAQGGGPILTFPPTPIFSPLQERAGELEWHNPAHPHPTMTRTPSTPRLRGGTPSPPTMLGGTRSRGDTLQQGGTCRQGGTRQGVGIPSRGWPCPPCLFGLVSGGMLGFFFGGGGGGYMQKQRCCGGWCSPF